MADVCRLHHLSPGGICLAKFPSQPPIPLPLPKPSLSPLPPTHLLLPSTKGISGTFTSWRSALAPKPPAHPTLSSSTNRAPGGLQNFVRGKGSYAPFAPGGLEVAAVPIDELENGSQEVEEDEEEEGGWKTRAPGLRRGMKLSGGEFLLIHH